MSQSGDRILPNGLLEVVKIIKTRLSDNLKLQVKAYTSFIGKFVVALGPSSKQFAKLLVGELVKNLSDKTKNLRVETLSTLDKFAGEVGDEVIL